MKSPKLQGSRETCTACAGTIILEFAALSRLTGDPIFEEKARQAMDCLWSQRHRGSDLVGTVLNVHSGNVQCDSFIYCQTHNEYYKVGKICVYNINDPKSTAVGFEQDQSTSYTKFHEILSFWHINIYSYKKISRLIKSKNLIVIVVILRLNLI